MSPREPQVVVVFSDGTISSLTDNELRFAELGLESYDSSGLYSSAIAPHPGGAD